LKKKIAFVIQLYGLEVNGGAEYHCRMIAEKLQDIYDVEVLTSCAKDHITWANTYPDGPGEVNGIKVRRFSTDHPRQRRELRKISKKINKATTLHKIARSLGLLNAYERFLSPKVTDKDYENWVRYQGPYLPKLITYLKENEANYDALIFFTYLYYPAIYGIDIAPQKSILVPTAHDEPQIYYPIFQRLFHTPKAILYNTLSEKRFVNRLFNNDGIYSAIAGVGIDAVKPAITPGIKDILKTDSPYIIYIGRIDAFKGCQLLIDHFLKYRDDNKADMKLVLVGKAFMQLPADEDIIHTGFVDENVKIALLQNAKALIMPSFYESLSLVTLESMAYGVPVIANQNCEVLKDHIENSHAGFLFNSYDSFKIAVDTISAPGFDSTKLSRNAKKYVAENYSWAAVIEKYHDAINYVSRH